MAEMGAETAIPKQEVARNSQIATKIRDKSKEQDPFARFNQGLGPREKSFFERLQTRRKKIVEKLRHQDQTVASSDRFTARNTNVADLSFGETNAAGVAKVKERITNLIKKKTEAGTIDAGEQEHLEKIRDELQEQSLRGPDIVQPIDHTDAAGNYVRQVEPTKTYRDKPEGAEKPQELRYILYNWDELRPGKPITVSFPSYNTPAEQNSTVQARDIEIAAHMPDRPMISIMHPGMGSGPLTEAQFAEMQTEDAYFSVADAALRLLKSEGVGLSSDDQIDIVGMSMGSFAGIALAERATVNDPRIGRIVLEMLVGAEDRKPLDVAMAMRRSGAFLPTAFSGPFHVFGFRGLNLHLSPLEQMKKTVEWLRSVPKNDRKFAYAKAMSNDTATERLEDVYEKQNNSSVVLVAGSEDAVSRLDATKKLIRHFRNLGIRKDRLALMLFQGEHHAVMENPARYAAITKSALTYELPKPDPSQAPAAA